MDLSKCGEMVENEGAWHASVHGVAESWTPLSNNSRVQKVSNLIFQTQFQHVNLGEQKKKQSRMLWSFPAAHVLCLPLVYGKTLARE